MSFGTHRWTTRAAFLLRTLGVAALGASGCGSSASPPPDAGVDPAKDPDDLADVLRTVRDKYALPGLAAAVIEGDRVIAIGAVGVRKVDDPTPVTRDDKWHLGSDTKAMTATLTAILVAEGKVKWSTTLAEAFPDATISTGYKPVTFEMLLAHWGGAPHDVPAGIWSTMYSTTASSMDARRTAVLAMIGLAPETPPGTAFVYANAGYMMVGAGIERADGRGWEEMMAARLFVPLGMRSCGFGPPASATGAVDQPWGHTVSGTTVTPVKPGPAADNPRSLGPAGTVHCSLVDWAKFLSQHLAGARGKDGIVSAASFTKMQTAWPGGDSALGWIVGSRPWAGGTVLTHSGSNTMFFAVVWIAPAKNRLMIAATNRGDGRAATAIDETLAPLIAKYFP